ncbi:MAG: methionine--tRNA ligase [archaeon]|nr:methionine--tRNA ligase [archaeon]
MNHISKFYITVAIDYPNTLPHIGHVYEKLTADTIARWQRLCGKNVFFLLGTDEHGLKIETAAKKAKLSPKDFVDEKAKQYKQTYAQWNFSFDRFIRTTDPGHEKVSQAIFKKVFDKKLIFTGEYEGFYCIDCEFFYLEKDLVNGNCPVHGTKCELLKEENYFFKMSLFQKQIISHIQKNPEFIQPKTKRNEVLSRLEQPLRDLSVSRASLKWGIPLPNDSSHVIYVWFDALLNYLSGIDYPNKKFKEFWPADIQLIGKDIQWHHCVIWPSILFAAEIKLPKTIFVHGFVNDEKGEKLSKSKGNAIDLNQLAKKYQIDSIRYFLLREIMFGDDGNFSEKKLIERNNNELANELGNLLNRVLTLIEKNCAGKIPSGKADKQLIEALKLKEIQNSMNLYELNKAIGLIFEFISSQNKFVNEKKVWELKAKEQENALYSLADSLRVTAILLEPFIPETSAKILQQLGIAKQKISLNECKFNLLKSGTKIQKKDILFKKIV